MCLSIPARIISIEGSEAVASLGGSEVKVALDLLDKAEPGDYVLIHTGFAIEKINEEEALATLSMLNELNK